MKSPKAQTPAPFATLGRFRSGLRVFTLVAPLALGLAIPAVATADAEAEARYPYDPACAWGRIANGKGMLLRCLSQSEAQSLAGKSPPPARGSLPESSKSKTEDKPEPVRKYKLDVGPIAATEGSITIGALQKPVERYRSCIDDNGGLLKKSAKITVDFLVHGERRRAEGAEVASYSGVRKTAAQCLAEVVDRRRVGTPSVAMTEATLTFRLTETR